MKRVILNLQLLTIACILFSAGNVFADVRTGAFTVSPMAGYHVIDGSSNIDDAAAFGLGLGYNLSPEWAFEADLRYTPTKLDFGKSNDVDIWTLSLGGLYHFRPAAVVNPYLSFGAGVMQYDFETGSDETNPMGYYGGGLKYALGESADLRLDLRHLLDYRNDDRVESPNNGSGRLQSNLQAMVGLTFQFGGAPVVAKQEAAPVAIVKAVEETPADSDHDGVLDPQDQCPKTATGVRVDSNGCPADTDGDGVADYLDACLDTPAGTEVDVRGCPNAAVAVVSLVLNLRFGFDKDQITPFHYSELKKAVEFIADYPTYPVIVKGHADDQGSAEYNQDLSQRRADNVRKALIDKYGVAADRISAVGFGEAQPVADNATVEGRKLNRRVEINIQP